MARRRRRGRRDRGTVYRVMTVLARAMRVVLVSVAVGYAFYLALRWAAEGARRGVGG